MPDPSRVAPSPALTRHGPFALFWSARVAGTIAYQMQAVAIGWQIYDLTGSALDLGLVGLVQFIPVVVLALVVGHVADRYERRRVVRACQLTEALAAAALATGSAGGWLDEAAILAIVLIVGTARAFELPALHALVPGLVPPQMFARAVAGSASANQIAIITGPALGGIIYAAGPAVVYGSAGALFLAAGVLVNLIGVPPARLATGAPTLASLFAGLAFIKSRPALLGAISLDLFAVLLGGATALLPIYARDILHSGPWGLGLLRSAPAFGALTASLVLAGARCAAAPAPSCSPRSYASAWRRWCSASPGPFPSRSPPSPC